MEDEEKGDGSDQTPIVVTTKEDKNDDENYNKNSKTSDGSSKNENQNDAKT